MYSRKLGSKQIKSAGPDNIPTRILKFCATEISPYSPNYCIYIYSLNHLGKGCFLVTGHVIYHFIMFHLEQNNILNPLQHRFRAGHSCTTQLLTMIEELAKSLDDRKQVDVDFAKAFDTVPHQHLLPKLQYYDITGRTHHWISRWLTNRMQRVVISGTESDHVNVISRVPQGTVLGPFMFLLCINDIRKNILLCLQMIVLCTDQSVTMMIPLYSRMTLT